MASHVRRDDRSLAAPVKAPHFFKIVLPDALRDWKIMIPKKFIRKCGERLSNPIFLKLPNGAEWKVQSLKCSGEVWLQEGWKEFADYCSLKPGHFLVFKYEGNSHFHVLVFDGSAVEIDYPSNSSVDEKDKIDEEFRVTRMKKKDFSTFFKRREKSPISCPRPHKMKRILPSAKTASTSNLSRLDPRSIPDGTQSKEQGNWLLIKKDFEDFGILYVSVYVVGFLSSNLLMMSQCHLLDNKGVGGMSTTKRSPKSVILERIRTSTVDEKARALQKARGFKPENPSFVVVMQQSYVYFGWHLHIPSGFAKRYLNKKLGAVILRVSDRRNWSITYSSQMAAGELKVKFRRGWKEFAQCNHLELGDVCAFEMIKGMKKTSFQVVIFRATEQHCPLLPECII